MSVRRAAGRRGRSGRGSGARPGRSWSGRSCALPARRRRPHLRPAPRGRWCGASARRRPGDAGAAARPADAVVSAGRGGRAPRGPSTHPRPAGRGRRRRRLRRPPRSGGRPPGGSTAGGCRVTARRRGAGPGGHRAEGHRPGGLRRLPAAGAPVRRARPRAVCGRRPARPPHRRCGPRAVLGVPQGFRRPRPLADARRGGPGRGAARAGRRPPPRRAPGCVAARHRGVDGGRGRPAGPRRPRRGELRRLPRGQDITWALLARSPATTSWPSFWSRTPATATGCSGCSSWPVTATPARSPDGAPDPSASLRRGSGSASGRVTTTSRAAVARPATGRANPSPNSATATRAAAMPTSTGSGPVTTTCVVADVDPDALQVVQGHRHGPPDRDRGGSGARR